ncbi:MAG: hypothetical protein V1876_01415 [Candidatus Peregrinibacteria bacterium]
MKTFHPLSFVLGLASGFLALFLMVGGLRILRPASQTAAPGNRAGFQQRQGGAMGGQNLSAMAEQLGMTQEDLQKELQAGRNLRDIATEKGVTLQFGNRIPLRQGSEGQVRGGSGAVLSSSDSSATSSASQK